MRVLDNQPIDVESLIAQGRSALMRRDWPELARCGSTLRATFPEVPEGFLFGKSALVGLDQRSTAEAMLVEGIKLFPHHQQMAIDHAWLAHERRDWPEARRRWDAIKLRFPNDAMGYVGKGIAEREAKLFDDADVTLSDAIERFPENPTVLIEYAWVAQHRGDIPEARQRWKALRDRFPDNRYGYLGAGVTEQSSGDFAAAEAVLGEGHRRFPTDEAIAVGYGWTGNLRRDWEAAIKRWRSLLPLFPNNDDIARGLDAALRESIQASVPKDMNLENGVLIGRNDVLFLAEGGHAVLEFASGRRQVSDESYDNFLRNLVQRHRIITAAGAEFLHVIFPDKHSVCTEDFPVESPTLLGQEYLRRLPGISHYICYPRDLLRQANRPTFMLTDTHMNDFGTILASALIVERLVKEPQTAHINPLIANINVEVDYSGDLGNKLTPPRFEKQLKNPMKWHRKWYHNNLQGGNNGIIDILFNNEPIYNKRLVWFGDSFGRAACQFMSYFFKETVFFRTPFFHAELFEQIRPDYVVTQNVERYLNSVPVDESRPSFLMYPYLNNLTYEPGVEFARAMSAVLSFGRKPYYDFLQEIGITP